MPSVRRRTLFRSHLGEEAEDDAPATPVVKAFEAYADELTAFLQKHPKTHMAALGGKVKRPKNMMMKVKEFLLGCTRIGSRSRVTS